MAQLTIVIVLQLLIYHFVTNTNTDYDNIVLKVVVVSFPVAFCSERPNSYSLRNLMNNEQ